MPNSVFINQNDERLRYQNRALLSSEHFEDYSANSDSISCTGAISGMQNQEPIIFWQLNLNLMTTTIFKGKMLKNRNIVIDSDLENLSEDQINALTDKDSLLYPRVALADQDNNDCERIREVLSKNPAQIFKTLNLKHCSSYTKALFFKSRLWIPAISKLQT